MISYKITESMCRFKQQLKTYCKGPTVLPVFARWSSSSCALTKAWSKSVSASGLHYSSAVWS